MTSIAQLKRPGILEETMEQAFPEVAPGVIPAGHRVLIQLKNSAIKTKGGLIIDSSSAQTENDNTQVGKVIALGPVAHCSRETLVPWPEKAWCAPGDFVRIPMHTNSQNTWQVPVPGSDGVLARFVLMDDLLILGVQPDPFYIRAFL